MIEGVHHWRFALDGIVASILWRVELGSLLIVRLGDLFLNAIADGGIRDDDLLRGIAG